MLALLLIMVKSLTESVNYNSVKLIMFTSQLLKGNEPGYAGSWVILKNIAIFTITGLQVLKVFTR